VDEEKHMKTNHEEHRKTTKRELNPRCRHHECVSARAQELASMGLVHFAIEIHTNDVLVRCRKKIA
jgi:hypothetical protein